MPEVVRRQVRSGDVRLNVAEAGDGAPVILLHGFPDSWQLWRYQIDALAATEHRVIAPDLRGFGASDRPADVARDTDGTLIGAAQCDALLTQINRELGL